MPGYYPDKPPTASNGRSFEVLVERLHWLHFGQAIGVFRDRWSQWNIGESRAGVEIKELTNSHTRLHIELAEKTQVDQPWVPSGIMRTDNAKRYVCGNRADIFAFFKQTLLIHHREARPREVWFGRDQATGAFRLGDVGDSTLLATIHSFVLDKSTADTLCLYRFRFYDGRWHVMPSLRERSTTSCAVPRGAVAPEDWAQWWARWEYVQDVRSAA